MYGAIIGDIVGSAYMHRADRIKTKNFPLFSEKCGFTDDTVFTVAVGNALVRAYTEREDVYDALVEEMQRLGRKYIHVGFSGNTRSWILSNDPRPYGSFGNGAAMRASPCGLMAVTLEEALMIAKASAEVSHDHPEGIKAAQAVAAAVFLAKTGKSKEEIGDYLRHRFYPLDKTLDEIRPTYRFDMTCQGSVPQAITCFLESESYEDAVRNAVSLGGNSDTQAAIAGSLAWIYYTRPYMLAGKEIWPQEVRHMMNRADALLPEEFRLDMERFNKVWIRRGGAYERIGIVTEIVRK